MVRTQVYLTEREKNALETVAAMRNVSQSVLIREAVDDLLSKQGTADKKSLIDDIAGIWANNKEVPDVRAMRAGWRRRAPR
jgi:hypothetical protein